MKWLVNLQTHQRVLRLWHSDAGFFLLALLLLGAGLWRATGITGLDEYWNSMRTALETFSQHSWWLPQLDGEPRLRKPPLLYWEMSASFATFGAHFWSARLPSLLLAAGFAVVMRQLSRQVLNNDGRLAGWLTLTVIVVTVEARRAMLDLPIAMFTACAVLWAWQAIRDGSRLRLALAVFAVTCGWMTKGPVILVFVGAAAVSTYFVKPLQTAAQTKPLSRWDWLAALGLLLMLCSVWPISVALQPNVDLFGSLNADATERQVNWLNAKSILQVLGGLLSTALPWSFVLIVAAARGLWRRQLPTDATQRWLLYWLALAAVPFLFMRTFERYLIPMLPPVILIVSARLEMLQAKARPHLLTATILIGLPCLLISLFALTFNTATLAPILVSLCLGAALFATFLARHTQTCMALASALCLTLGLVYPSIGVNALPDAVTHTLAKAPANTPIYHFAHSQPGVLSMNLGRSVRIIDPTNRAMHALAQQNGYLILNKQDQNKLRTLLNNSAIQWEPVVDFGMFYARTTFLKFARSDATPADWRDAVHSGSLDNLKSQFLLVRLHTPTTEQQAAYSDNSELDTPIHNIGHDLGQSFGG